MGGCSDINSCNADNNRTYQRKLLLNFSSITISMDLCRGKCIKRTTSSGEFAGFASGTPKEREKTGLYDNVAHIRLVQGSRNERYLFCWSWKLKLTLHSYNWRRPILHPMNLCKLRSQSTEDHFYLKNLVCFRKKLINAIQLAEQRKADQF